MLRFLVRSAASPGEDDGEKEATPPKRVKANQQEYELNRKRTFQPAWQKEFPWVLFDGSSMFCRPCRSSYGALSTSKLPDRGQFRKYSKGPFVVGSSNLKKTTLTAHQETEGHILAVTHANNKTNPTESSAHVSLRQLNHAAFGRLDKLFRNAHALAMHNRPMTDFMWLADLDERKGLAVGETYRTDKACKAFTEAIANVEKVKQMKQLQEAKFVTIVADGSTDVSVQENEIVYVFFSVNGVQSMQFCDLQHVRKADADGVFNALERSLTELGVSTRKVVGFTGDGARVNTGELNGVIAKMRSSWSPSIIMVRCLVHRLELAMKDALKEDKLYDRVCTLLHGVYSFYHKSPLQRAELKASFASLGLTPAIPVRVGGTRWMSHTAAALSKLWKAYAAIVNHLCQVSNKDGRLSGKAKGLLKLLRCKPVIWYAHFLHDIVTCLAKLSLVLQQTNASLYMCHEEIVATIISLEKLRDRPGFFLRQIWDDNGFQGQVMVGVFRYPDTTVQKLVDSVEKRYSDISTDVLEATRIADIRSWPIDFQAEFGDDFVISIIDHWQETLLENGVDCALVSHEWNSIKRAIYSNGNINELSWPAINAKYREAYPNILDVIDLLLSLPASSAECERGFSTLKLIKTDQRNRLQTVTLKNMMRIRLQSPSIQDFDPSEAIDMWNHSSSRARRPMFKASTLGALQEENTNASASAQCCGDASNAVNLSISLKSSYPDEDEDMSDVDSLLGSTDNATDFDSNDQDSDYGV